MTRLGWTTSGMVALAIALLVARAGTRRRPPPVAPVREAVRQDPQTYWAREGFVQMEPPVRPPTSEDGREHIVVYLRVPPGMTLSIQGNGDGRLEYPEGTIADRVEYRGAGSADDAPTPDWTIEDVRGTSIGKDGQVFHVYRPTLDGTLLGAEWPRGLAAAQAEATRVLVGFVEDGRVLGPPTVPGRARVAEALRSLNDCASCHTEGRDPALSAGRSPRRGTDASGFFSASTVLTDRAPLEEYRPNNPNLHDPYMRFVCGATEEPARVEGGRVSCRGGLPPIGILDVRAA